MAQMSAGSKSLPTYPPYNVIRDGDQYTIEVALAGIDKKDLAVEAQENTLSISYESSNKDEEGENKLYRGIAQRSFRRQFSLSEDVEVTGATFKNGLLKIDLERIIPEEKRPKLIKIK
jgi:molecular chaperone IbpA